MARLSVDRKVYDNIQSLDITCNSAESVLIGVNHGEGTISIKVPSYLRIEVDGNTESVISNGRVEVHGYVDVGRGNKLFKCDGRIDKFTTDSNGLKRSTIDGMSGKIMTFAEEQKALGKSLGRATVMHITGDVNFYIVERWRLKIDTIIRGKAKVAVANELGVKGDIRCASSANLAMCRYKPKQVIIDENITRWLKVPE